MPKTVWPNQIIFGSYRWIDDPRGRVDGGVRVEHYETLARVPMRSSYDIAAYSLPEAYEDHHRRDLGYRYDRGVRAALAVGDIEFGDDYLYRGVCLVEIDPRGFYHPYADYLVRYPSKGVAIAALASGAYYALVESDDLVGSAETELVIAWSRRRAD